MFQSESKELDFKEITNVSSATKKHKIGISSVFLYDPLDKDHEEDFYNGKFYYPPTTNIHEQSKQAGLCAGVIEFIGDFASEHENYADTPVETISTSLFTLVVKQYEPGFYLCIIFSHDEMYFDQSMDSETGTGVTISNMEHVKSLFREEDNGVFNDILDLFYQLFSLFHNSFKTLYDEDPILLKKLMLDFTEKFDTYFFKQNGLDTYFNIAAFRGYYIGPIDPTSWLYVQKGISSITNGFSDKKGTNLSPQTGPNLIVFFDEFYLYSEIPQDQVEIVHKYIFGSSYVRRFGYQPNWIDSKIKGEMRRIKVSQPLDDSYVISDEKTEVEERSYHQLVEELGFEDIEYDQVLDKQFSPFCRVNPDSFKGSKQDISGYIIGPTLSPETQDQNQLNDQDENSVEYFDIFAPKVYLRDKACSNLKTEYRLILARFERVTYVLLYKDDEYKKPEQYYKDLSQILEEKAISIAGKIDPIVEYNDENPIYEEDIVKFYYYNQINLAIKFTPHLNKNILSNEIRHFMNVIKSKFDNNSSLYEYQITTTNYWLIGKKSGSKILIVIVSSSVTQDAAENEAKRISEHYFSNFIFSA